MVSGTKNGSQFWLMEQNLAFKIRFVQRNKKIFHFWLTVKMVTNRKCKQAFVPLTNFEGQLLFRYQILEAKFCSIYYILTAAFFHSLNTSCIESHFNA